MIQSMTAFARAQSQGQWGAAVCEVKSVNHRYLEFRVHLPESFYGLESSMQDYLRKQVKRGKVECYFRFLPNATVDVALQVNLALAKRLIQVNQELAQLLPGALTINSMDILQWPGVIQTTEASQEGVHQELMTLLQSAVQDLVAMRQ